MSVEVSGRASSGKKASDALIGQTLASRYLIERRLGEGAMGAVYRARHVKLGRPFAVKVLHPDLPDGDKLAQRFAREAELAGRLHHPNVIGVVDVGETADGMRYMVMDFAEGVELADLLAEAPLPPERITSLVRQMLEGLYHAHEAGLIHRDFKPENVIVERDDHDREVPRIVDFGISILSESGETADATGRLTTNGLVLGTPHYMAPEQAVADPIDHRIDLFAMGIVVYEMLSGRLPFDGAGAEVARANLLQDPPPISKRVPGLEVDPLLEAFARRLMSKNRDKRPATAKAARELLDLIERDRAAAAAALGLPLAAGAREPLATQPIAQQAPPTGSLPPPAPTGSSAAIATTGGSIPIPITLATAMAAPLPWRGEAPPARRGAAPRPRRRWLLLGGAILAAAGAIAAITVGGGAKQPQPQESAASAAPASVSAPAAEPAQPAAEPAQPPAAPVPPPAAPVPPEIAPSAAAPSAPEPAPAPEPSPAPKPSKGRTAKASRSGAPAIKSDRSRSTRPEVARPEPARPEPTKPEPAKLEVARPEPPRPEPARPEPAKPEPAKPEPAKVEVAKPEPARPAPAASQPGSIQDEWRAVLNEINELSRSRGQNAAAAPRARWQLIKIQEAIRLPAASLKAAAELAQIRKMIADARKN